MIKSTIFKDARSRFHDSKDSNFCGPMAIGILANQDPVEVSKMMIESGRRKKGQGTQMPAIMEQGNILGLTFINRTKEVKAAGAKSVNSIVNIIDPNKNYLVGVRNHCLAIVRGEVHDWTNDRMNRITDVHEVKDGELGILRVNVQAVKADSLALDLCDQIRVFLGGTGTVHKSGGEARICFGGESCYIRKSRNGYMLQYGKNVIYRIGPDTDLLPATKITTQYVNFEFSTLEEACATAYDSAGCYRYEGRGL